MQDRLGADLVKTDHKVFIAGAIPYCIPDAPDLNDTVSSEQCTQSVNGPQIIANLRGVRIHHGTHVSARHRTTASLAVNSLILWQRALSVVIHAFVSTVTSAL